MTGPLAPLIAYRQWIIVRLVPRANGRTDKIPLHPVTGQPHNAHDPPAWFSHADATARAAALGADHTIGFVLTAADPFWCLDIDGCRTADGWSAQAHALIAELPGTVVEVSQSGNGLHVWGQGVVPPHGKKRVDLGIELYSELRFIAIGTGHVGDMSVPCPTIGAFASRYFPVDATPATPVPTTGPRADWRGPTDDDDLIRRALNARGASAVFGGRAAFADLWAADVAVLSRAYPPDASSSEPYDRSSADAALAQHLAFWTGCDVARIERLMRRSALARDKWNDRSDYLVARTIVGACGRQVQVLTDKPPEPSPFPAAPAAPAAAPLTVTDLPAESPGLAPAPAPDPGAVMTRRVGDSFVTPGAQNELFRGFVYVQGHHKVMCPGGKLLSPDVFRASFGGRTFAMDLKNERTTRNAFEAFTESQVWAAPQVDGTAFLPLLPYGTIVEAEGRRCANIYWPANVRRVRGDASPFLNHLRLLFPNPEDQRILLYYMAACVQYAGHKFQWMPLLVGCEGNGKTILSLCVTYAVGRRYSHWPAADKLGKQFNAWIFGKLFFAIEDLMIGDSLEVWEKLKPMITGEFLEVEAKGIDQRTDEVCGNFIANSNHKGAAKKTANDRRIAPLWCAQQHIGDLAKCGMSGGYMPRLYHWLRTDGFAIVAEYLHTVDIPPEYGLAWLKGRAPRTSSTDDAIAESRGAVEQEILEAIAREEQGFRGGWISSGYLDALLRRINRERAIPLNRRRDVLQGLGFDWHPGLPDGRVHNAVLPDGAKVKLFIRAEHASRQLTSAAAIAAAYSAAQGIVGPAA